MVILRFTISSTWYTILDSISYPALTLVYVLCFVWSLQETLVCNISQRPKLKTRREIWPANNFPSFNLNPNTSTVFRFFVDNIAYMPDATYSTRIMEIPVDDNNGTTVKHKSKR